MKENKAFDPTDIGLFGAVSVVFTADCIANLIQKFRLVHFPLLSKMTNAICYTLIIQN